MPTNTTSLEKLLSESFQDKHLDFDEKTQLSDAIADTNVDERRFLKNRAFDLVKHYVREQNEQHDKSQDIYKAIRWLEKVNKTIEKLDLHQESDAFFSPGSECRDAIINLCQKSKHSISICVFTISDNRISDAIKAAHSRGVKVRVITDNDKRHDAGSDIESFENYGISVRLDKSPQHMHHKFALFDEKTLLNGSFNWTRSASDRNEENIVIHFDSKLIDIFNTKFEKLWIKFS